MSYRIRVSRRAARQIRAASAWWLENREKAPLAFAEDLQDALQVIATLPKVGEARQHARIPDLRRLLLARTRYHLYYAVSDDTRSVDVLVLWHVSRGDTPRL